MIERVGSIILIKFLSIILPNISEALKESLKELLKELKEKAEKTQNPYDDLFIEFLYTLFNINN
jgi:predicted HTH domain antitoxin